MFYPAFKSIWLPERLTRTHIARGISLPLLTLGNLRNLEIIEHPTASAVSREATAEDLAALLLISGQDWRRSLRMIARPHLFAFRSAIMFRRIQRRITEVQNGVFDWWGSQNDVPERFKSEAEMKALSMPRMEDTEYGSTPALRLALLLSKRTNWREITGLKSVWDIPKITAYALLIAQGENEGQHYLSRDTSEALAEVING